jgi:hypothetical protein
MPFVHDLHSRVVLIYRFDVDNTFDLLSWLEFIAGVVEVRCIVCMSRIVMNSNESIRSRPDRWKALRACSSC